MIPVHFGSPAEPLYGVHHRPETPVAGSVGVVLCQPVFHEATNCHRAFRSLADRFARAGVHALRFDYRGTGDSAGDGQDCSVECWVGDILEAREELLAARGLRSVGLVGLRLGASLAALAAARCPGLPFLTLWEPIAAGGSFLQDLRRVQRDWVESEAQERPRARKLATGHEVLGHWLPSSLATGLGALDLEPRPMRLAERTLLVDEGVCGRMGDLGRAFGLAGSQVEHWCGDYGRIWGREQGGEQVQVPHALLTNIVDWVKGEEGH
jgi:alpha-beta hydrolase superfamily lysophospholipase